MDNNNEQQLSTNNGTLTHKDEFVFKNTTQPNGDIGDSGDESDSQTNTKKDEGAAGDEAKPNPRRSGRRKIKIEYIEDKNRRHITFSKRKAGIMKKAYELSTLTGTQVLLLVVSETGLVYTFTTVKLQPIVTKPEGKNLIQQCLNAPDPMSTTTSDVPPSPQVKDEDANTSANPQQQENNPAYYQNDSQLKDDQNSSMTIETHQQYPPSSSNSAAVAAAAAATNLPTGYPSNAYGQPPPAVPYGYPTGTSANSNMPSLNAPYGYNTASAPQAQPNTGATSPHQQQQAYMPNSTGYYQPYMSHSPYHQQQQQAPAGYWAGNNPSAQQQHAAANSSEAPNTTDRNI
ncbi:hypothetical protein BDF20DRAFT_859089 [Mycotypha africana]|uniref:uncharacterized protein n=1 Tax=Mycotypha africana TaxID=64632 RepID=UPI0023010705|nr:uncharacterized protein BDF20DRAFT_859089 [Mycotypha africana]KAI8984292.1 hypothetical protein BDF20DRAFT_859089 [Mycotypha africana]